MAECCVPVAQMQNCSKRSEFEQRETALHQNISEKGEFAYYQAHRRHFEIPEGAKIISGPGLVTGGPPELVEKGDEILKEEDKITFIKDYSWADAGAKVKVYVPCEGMGDALTQETCEAKFEKTSLILNITATSPMRRLKLEKLHGEINPEESKVRVEPAKQRVTLVLVKRREKSWMDLTNKK
mmetsp:Transcript_90280/g.165652  ORF Transcript_90280/g.165652 Transcript_90280/m.165652 type:complete len:183 (-) Transcript_90280:105-653(-)